MANKPNGSIQKTSGTYNQQHIYDAIEMHKPIFKLPRSEGKIGCYKFCYNKYQ